MDVFHIVAAVTSHVINLHKKDAIKTYKYKVMMLLKYISTRE